MYTVAFIIGALAGVGTLVLTSGLFFKSPEEFEDALRYSTKINLLSLLKGEYAKGELKKRFWLGNKGSLWILSGLVVGLAVASAVSAVLTALFSAGL